jgi:hypothetical protein
MIITWHRRLRIPHLFAAALNQPLKIGAAAAPRFNPDHAENGILPDVNQRVSSS